MIKHKQFIHIQKIKDGQEQECEAILRALPDWFGIEKAIVQYVSDLNHATNKNNITFVAYVDDRVVGFITLHLHQKWSAEIHVMGVLPEFHGRGVGSQLIFGAENFLRSQKIPFFTVKTLSPSREDSFYEKTRNFYLSQGFQPLEEFKTLWGEDNPCLIMIKNFIMNI